MLTRPPTQCWMFRIWFRANLRGASTSGLICAFDSTRVARDLKIGADKRFVMSRHSENQNFTVAQYLVLESVNLDLRPAQVQGTSTVLRNQYCTNVLHYVLRKLFENSLCCMQVFTYSYLAPGNWRGSPLHFALDYYYYQYHSTQPTHAAGKHNDDPPSFQMYELSVSSHCEVYASFMIVGISQ
jgi:hypothetical protein